MAMNKANVEYKEIELQELFGYFITKWWLIVLLPLMAGGMAHYITVEKVAPTYTAQSTIFIGQDSTNALKINVSDLNLDSQLIADYQELVTTRLISERVIKELALHAAPLSGYLNVTTVGESRFMHISFTSHDPELAMKIVNKYSDVLKENAESVVGVKNVKIIDYAVLPQKPSGPNVMKNSLIASMLGFIAAMGIILLLMMLNNTVQKEEEIERELGLPVLGVIPWFKGELRS